jgi:hypothetical protein
MSGENRGYVKCKRSRARLGGLRGRFFVEMSNFWVDTGRNWAIFSLPFVAQTTNGRSPPLVACFLPISRTN